MTIELAFPANDNNGLAADLRVVLTVNGPSAWFETNLRALGIAPGSRDEFAVEAVAGTLLRFALRGVDVAADSLLEAAREALDASLAAQQPHPADSLDEDPHGLPL